MKRFACMVLLAGCASCQLAPSRKNDASYGPQKQPPPQTHRVDSGSKFIITRLGTPFESSKRPSTFIPMSRVVVDRETLDRPFPPFRWVETGLPLRIDVLRDDHDEHGPGFAAVIGPWPDGRGVARFHGRNSDETLYMEGGWVIFWGYWPIFQKPHILAGGEGTIFAVEIVDEDLTRVYFPDLQPQGQRVVVTCTDEPTNQKILDQPGDFLEIHGTCTIGDPQPIANDPEALAFMEYATACGIAAGGFEFP